MRRRLAAPVLLGALLLGAWPRAAQGQPAGDQAARIVAQALAEAIAARDAEAAAVLCALPANLDGQVVTTAEALRQRWQQVLDRDELQGLRLEQLETATLAEMIERHGPPPTRLGELPPEALVARLRWNRAQLVVILARRDDRWAVIAVTD